MKKTFSPADEGADKVLWHQLMAKLRRIGMDGAEGGRLVGGDEKWRNESSSTLDEIGSSENEEVNRCRFSQLTQLRYFNRLIGPSIHNQ